jgi:hypothetical protein
VTGLGLNDQIRLRIKSVTFTDQTGLGSYTLSVHGFNVPTDADPDNGVTYTTATDTVESAMPDAEDGARWIARDVT